MQPESVLPPHLVATVAEEMSFLSLMASLLSWYSASCICLTLIKEQEFCPQGVLPSGAVHTRSQLQGNFSPLGSPVAVLMVTTKPGFSRQPVSFSISCLHLSQISKPWFCKNRFLREAGKYTLNRPNSHLIYLYVIRNKLI